MYLRRTSVRRQQFCTTPVLPLRMRTRLCLEKTIIRVSHSSSSKQKKIVGTVVDLATSKMTAPRTSLCAAASPRASKGYRSYTTKSATAYRISARIDLFVNRVDRQVTRVEIIHRVQRSKRTRLNLLSMTMVEYFLPMARKLCHPRRVCIRPSETFPQESCGAI